ncbi:MAG: amino acid adenylation domain-containing protein, partial [Phormidium sp.]
ELVRFDLELHLWEEEKTLEGSCCYNRDLFDRETIARMMQHFQILLKAIVANPQQSVSLLPFLTQQERHQLLEEWTDTQTNFPQNKCIHQLFEEQVQRTPDAVAVIFENQQLTYQQLNSRANQLAHYLRSLGVGADALVGICVERSLEMVVGLLGILKAGGAYVPLDPEYPIDRLNFMLADTQVKLLLTQEKLVETLTKHQAQIISLDRDWQTIAQASQNNLETTINSENLAYITYTSGSTGTPKGVMVPHQAVNRLVKETNYIEITAKDRIAQAANIAFDAATFEIWGALLNGSQLIIITKSVLLSPAELAEHLKEKQITVLFLTTALFNQIASAAPQAFSSIRSLLFGGEAVDPIKVKEILEKGAPQQLLHVYGPTENTTFTSWYLVENLPENATTVPIGKAIANTQIYVLDGNLQPVPVGTPGELHIGGIGLAKGYLNRQELTNEKFIPNPFENSKLKTQNSKLYKTGDLVRFLPDGNIEYLGRIDNQVKIRGFRIELGEIEVVLRQHPLIQECVVIARVDSPGDKRLIAYLVPGLDREALDEQVNQWQSEYLSDWQTLYEQAYSQEKAATSDPTFNIAGWNSSYTREPIPAVEMRVWVESTVSRILSVSPQRVLEIGCGTGLLLSRIATNATEYWGTDYSRPAIQYVEQLCSTIAGLEKVRLRQQTADDFTGIPKANFDTIILNSVVQYFPSVDYLLQVLEGSVDAIGTQGAIFVGDVRSLPLLEPYHAAVQLYQATDNRNIQQWQQQVRQNIASEEELAIDPKFFIALKQRFPQITWVEIQPKRGYAQNELTQFRYDVTLHLGIDIQPRIVPWLNWQLDQLSLPQIQNHLHQEQPEILGIRRVPNSRTQQALQIWQWVEKAPNVETVSQLRELLAQHSTEGINPEEFWELGEQLGYKVYLSWWESSQNGSFDVVFCRHSSHSRSEAIAFWEDQTFQAKPWTDYTNNPLQGKLVQKLVPQVRDFIQQKLPNYMVPSAFVLLSALPLTPNGKVDRRALPAPDTASRNLVTGFVSARTPIEAQLVQIWSEILGIASIGVKDNFFELGGHSLLATQVISRIKTVLNLQ